MPLALGRLLARLALAAALVVAGGAARAGCEGPGLLDRLSPERRAALAAEVQATPHAEGLLWVARRGAATALVVGTLHLPDPRHRAMLRRLAPALAAADLVLLETTPAEEAGMRDAVAATPAIAVLTEAPFLPDRLDPAAWTAVAAAAEVRGMPPELAARYRPWLLMMALAAPPCLTALPGEQGLDRLILEAAGEAGTPVAALEPWDTLFRALGGADEALQLEMLKLSLLDPGPAAELLVGMREGYFAGRSAEVWELTRVAAEIRPEGLGPPDPAALDRMEAALLSERNAAWVPVIDVAAARGATRLVVAAGAAHLPGEEGLLRLLERDGWTVAPRPDCCAGVWETP
jgi:hypothetical protein